MDIDHVKRQILRAIEKEVNPFPDDGKPVNGENALFLARAYKELDHRGE